MITPFASLALLYYWSWIYASVHRDPLLTYSLILGKPRLNEDGYLTHLQKFSRFGFLVTFPFCFHFWFMWKPQEFFPEDKNGLYGKPGSEGGIYFRTPGYRWDVDLGMKWTWGYAGLHWD